LFEKELQNLSDEPLSWQRAFELGLIVCETGTEQWHNGKPFYDHSAYSSAYAFNKPGVGAAIAAALRSGRISSGRIIGHVSLSRGALSQR
jgi:hypothetical protein